MKRTFGSRQETKTEGLLRPIFFPALTFMDVFTGDRRKLASAGGGVRELPLTIYAAFDQGPGGHVGSVIAGVLHEVTLDDEGVASASGWVLDDDNGRQLVFYAETQALRGNSVDLADVKAHYEWDEEADDIAILFDEWNIAATTIVGKPAFSNARFSLEDELVASWMQDESPLVIDLPSSTNVMVAQAEIVADGAKRPPWDLFHQSEPDTPQKLTVGEPDENGWIPVTGHLALWNTCHDGLSECVMPPRSPDNYAGFNCPGVLTDKGMVNTGPIFAIGGHPKAGTLSKMTVAEAYGGIENAWADVRTVEGRLGPWCSGYVRPGTDDDLVVAARASKVSGHWLGGSLKAIVSVNTPGYEVPGESFAMAADGTISELVASFPACELDDSGEPVIDEQSSADEFDDDGFDMERLQFELARQDLLAE
jgi:hypothetical protein